MVRLCVSPLPGSDYFMCNSDSDSFSWDWRYGTWGDSTGVWMKESCICLSNPLLPPGNSTDWPNNCESLPNWIPVGMKMTQGAVPMMLSWIQCYLKQFIILLTLILPWFPNPTPGPGERDSKIKSLQSWLETEIMKQGKAVT